MRHAVLSQYPRSGFVGSNGTLSRCISGGKELACGAARNWRHVESTAACSAEKYRSKYSRIASPWMNLAFMRITWSSRGVIMFQMKVKTCGLSSSTAWPTRSG
eukprot:177015-Prymnesium_polylepis.1